MISSIVTGGAGFVGSHLVDALTKRGESVLVLDNLMTGRLGNLENAISSGRVTFVYADIAVDPSALRRIVADCGARRIRNIFHFAALGGNSDADTASVRQADDERGTASLIELALEHDARFVFTSVVEEHDLIAAGEPALAPYERGRSEESAVVSAIGKRGLDGRIVRLFNCYGPRMHHDDFSLLVEQLEAAVNGQPIPVEGNGGRARCLTYVEDAVRLLLIVAGQPRASAVPIEAANDAGQSDIDIARSLANVVNIDFIPAFFPGRSGGRQHWPDLSRAREIGWRPTTSLEDGLRFTYDWFLRESRLFV